jgi:hypothetical protein
VSNIKKISTSDGVKLKDVDTGKLMGSEGIAKNTIPTASTIPNPSTIAEVPSADAHLQVQYDMVQALIGSRVPQYLTLSPKAFLQYFDDHWSYSTRPHTASLNWFKINGVSRYWALEFNAEHDMNLYVGRKDNGDIFAVSGYGIHNVASYDPIVLELSLKGTHEIGLSRARFQHAFRDLDENGDPETLEERCAEYWNYIMKDLEIVDISSLETEEDIANEILANLSPAQFADEFNRLWSWPPPSPHTLGFNRFPIRGAQQWWEVNFEGENWINIYIGKKDDGECFMGYGERLYSVSSGNGATVYSLDLSQIQQIGLCESDFEDAFYEYDMMGNKQSRKKRTSAIWNRIAKELEL